jgi:TolB-like protein
MVVLPTLCFAQNSPRVVVLPLENRAGTQYAYDAETLGELLSNFISETQRLNVIDRFEMDAAMTAQSRKMDDWADNTKTAEMGRALNAEYIVRGTVSRLGDNLLVAARILDIATAELRSSTNTQLESMNEAYSKMNSMSQILIYNLRLPIQQTQPPAVQTSPVVLVTVPGTGTLEIHTITAGTVEIVGAMELTGTEEVTGPGISYTVQIPAWSSIPPMTVNAGRYRVIMRYNDGKTEEKWVNVRRSNVEKLMFNYYPAERLNTLGASVGVRWGGGGWDETDMISFLGTIQGTYSPESGSFFELGMDIGGGDFVSWFSRDYFSLHPFIRYAHFLPFATESAVGGGWYIGGGVGFFFNTYTDTWEDNYVSKEGKVSTTAITINASTGFIFRSGFTISLGVFIGMGWQDGRGENVEWDDHILAYSAKLSIGYSYRIKGKEQGANNK